MPRTQDILFALLGVALIALMAFHFGVILFALLGAFGCGSIYLFAGMLPSRHEAFWHRVFITVFLSLILSSLVLIIPGTFGASAARPDVERVVMAIAGLLPLIAIGFEIIRTPRVTRGILRCLGYR